MDDGHRMVPNKYGTPRGREWPKYCRERDLGWSLPAHPPGHKQRQIRSLNAAGISTGDLVRIRNRNEVHTGYAMFYQQGNRIALHGRKPTLTGKVTTPQLIARRHGYTLRTAPSAAI